MDGPGASATGGTARTPAGLRWLEAAELTVGAVLLATIFALTLVQAAQRYLPVDGWVWSGELARFGLVWLSFALAGYLMGRDGHVTLQLVDYVAKGWVLRAVWILANLTVACVCVAFTVEAYALVTGPALQRSPAMGMPMPWLYMIPLLGFALTALRALGNALLRSAPADHDRVPAPESPTP